MVDYLLQRNKQASITDIKTVGIRNQFLFLLMYCLVDCQHLSTSKVKKEQSNERYECELIKENKRIQVEDSEGHFRCV